MKGHAGRKIIYVQTFSLKKELNDFLWWPTSKALYSRSLLCYSILHKPLLHQTLYRVTWTFWNSNKKKSHKTNKMFQTFRKLLLTSCKLIYPYLTLYSNILHKVVLYANIFYVYGVSYYYQRWDIDDKISQCLQDY